MNQVIVNNMQDLVDTSTMKCQKNRGSKDSLGALSRSPRIVKKVNESATKGEHNLVEDATTVHRP